MNVLEFSFLVAIGSLIAGFLGALTGLGGGVVLVPFLTLFFHVDIRYAIGASLVSVIATFLWGCGCICERRLLQHTHRNVSGDRPTLGGLLGAYLALKVPTHAIAIIFGRVLLYSAYLSGRPQPPQPENPQPDPLATRLKMNGTYPSPTGMKPYFIRRVPTGFGIMFGAGTLSGLLGIGSGAVKVLAMDQAMRIPFKVSTTTSNFMIGVTAAASAGIYMSRGYIDPGVAMPVMLGVLTGSLLGAQMLVKIKTRSVRSIFTVVILILALEMLYSGVTGRI